MPDFRPTIAKKLQNGPLYMHSFQPLKTTVERMIADGHVERVFPPGGKARNMVKLTAAGEKRWLRA